MRAVGASAPTIFGVLRTDSIQQYNIMKVGGDGYIRSRNFLLTCFVEYYIIYILSIVFGL